MTKAMVIDLTSHARPYQGASTWSGDASGDDEMSDNAILGDRAPNQTGPALMTGDHLFTRQIGPRVKPAGDNGESIRRPEQTLPGLRACSTLRSARCACPTDRSHTHCRGPPAGPCSPGRA